MKYRFETNEIVRIVDCIFNQPDEMKKLVNIFDAVQIQWEDFIQSDRLDQDQTAILSMIQDRLEVL